MIVRDARGNELLEVIDVPEEQAEDLYNPVNHCLAVVKVGNEYLMGWNHWRKNWEIFGGCKEAGENMRQCIIRECREELGIENGKFIYLGLMHDKMAPGYFSPEWHYEYGGLYGITLPEDALADIQKKRTDKEEVEKFAFYSEIKGKELIAAIDEKLLEYYTNFGCEEETCEGDRYGTV